MTPRDYSEGRETRTSWIVALAVGVPVIVFAVAAAFGFKTPNDHFAAQDAHAAVQDAKLNDHETRIQKLEDMKLTLEAIRIAVGADKPVRGHR